MKKKHESKPKKHGESHDHREESPRSDSPRYRNGTEEKVEQDMILRR